jgi:hypothetical protein
MSALVLRVVLLLELGLVASDLGVFPCEIGRPQLRPHLVRGSGAQAKRAQLQLLSRSVSAMKFSIPAGLGKLPRAPPAHFGRASVFFCSRCVSRRSSARPRAEERCQKFSSHAILVTKIPTTQRVEHLNAHLLRQTAGENEASVVRTGTTEESNGPHPGPFDFRKEVSPRAATTRS